MFFRPSEGILDDLSDVESDNGKEKVEKEEAAEKMKSQEKSVSLLLLNQKRLRP